MPAPFTTPIEKGWIADTGRRRSMRVLLSVPILVSGKTVQKQDFAEETRTLVVNAHGALISLKTVLVAGQKVTLEHKASQERLECRVVYASKPQGGWAQAGIEFLAPSPFFWHIDFPPDDWVSCEN